MGMYAFKLMILFSLTARVLVESVGVLDNSSDLWRTWLLKEDEEIPSQQSSPLSRRITPKSVFIAPSFNRCPESDRLDKMGNCVKIVRVDEAANEAAQWNSLLQKLNSMYSYGDENTFKAAAASNEKDAAEKVQDIRTSTENSEAPSSPTYIDEPSGPFQLSIPFQSKNVSDSQPDDDNADRDNSTFAAADSVVETFTLAEHSATELPNGFITDINTTEKSTEQTEIPVSTIFAEENNTNFEETEFATTESTETTATATATTSTSVSDATVTTDTPPFSEITPPAHIYINYKDKLYDRKRDDVRKDGTSTPDSVYYQYPSIPLRNKNPEESTTSMESSYFERSTTVVAPNRTFLNNLKTVANDKNRYVMNSKFNYNVNTNLDSRKTYNNDTVNNNINNVSSVSASSSSNSNTFDSYSNNDSISSSSSIRTGSVSSISSSSSNSNSISSTDIDNSKNDMHQKLPSNGKLKPKCDPESGYNDCIFKFNVLPTDKTSHYSSSRKPINTYRPIRFPEISSSSFVRFPVQKLPTSSEDISFEDTDLNSRYWESSRYPQFIRIWPDNAAIIYNTANMNYNLRPQSDIYSRTR